MERGQSKKLFWKRINLFKNGTLKLIKVAPQASYPLHHHPDKTEYAYVLKGSPEFEISGEHFTGKPDEFFIFPQNENHTILNKTDETCLMLVGAINH